MRKEIRYHIEDHDNFPSQVFTRGLREIYIKYIKDEQIRFDHPLLMLGAQHNHNGFSMRELFAAKDIITECKKRNGDIKDADRILELIQILIDKTPQATSR